MSIVCDAVGREPLKTMNKYACGKGNVYFGCNLLDYPTNTGHQDAVCSDTTARRQVVLTDEENQSI